MPINAVAAYLPNFLVSSFKKSSPCYIHRLPLDIHIDCIFPYLYIEDILCLRRVDKLFFLLTHEPIIWKRFILRMKIPIPPIRPTFRWALRKTDFEIEQLVTRAISVDDNWRSIFPPKTHGYKAMDAHHRILDMKLLPGGKYLLASVRDLSNQRYFVTLFSLDHPKGSRAIARAPTEVKAYDIQAKYTKYRGKHCIMVAYLRRRFLNGVRTAGIDPSDYSHRTDIDPPSQFYYECTCLHISLDSLEVLGDPTVVPGSEKHRDLALTQRPPFLEVFHLESQSELSAPTLFEYNDKPFLAVAQQPNRVLIMDLTSQVLSTMACHNHGHRQGSTHRIRAVRAIPDQNIILIIRSVSGNDFHEYHSVETYEAPSVDGLTERLAQEEFRIDDKKVLDFHVSDHGIPTKGPHHPHFGPPSDPPPPISIFMRTEDPIGVVHLAVWPVPPNMPVDDDDKGPHNLKFIVRQSIHISSPWATHILPGTYRSLMYTVMPNDRADSPRLLRLRRYFNPNFRAEDYPPEEEDTSELVLRKKRLLRPAKPYETIPLPEGLFERLNAGGITSIAWDEGIGRVCIAAGDELNVHVLDFGQAENPDARFAEWQRRQSLWLTNYM